MIFILYLKIYYHVEYNIFNKKTIYYNVNSAFASLLFLESKLKIYKQIRCLGNNKIKTAAQELILFYSRDLRRFKFTNLT